MEWKSNAKFGQDEKDGTTFTLKACPFPVTIHQYVGCGKMLFLTCKELSIVQIELETEDFDEAVSRAKQYIRKKLDNLNAGFRPFLEANERNEFVRH